MMSDRSGGIQTGREARRSESGKRKEAKGKELRGSSANGDSLVGPRCMVEVIGTVLEVVTVLPQPGFWAGFRLVNVLVYVCLFGVLSLVAFDCNNTQSITPSSPCLFPPNVSHLFAP